MLNVELSVSEIASGILAHVGLRPVRVGEAKNIHRNVELSVSNHVTQQPRNLVT